MPESKRQRKEERKRKREIGREREDKRAISIKLLWWRIHLIIVLDVMAAALDYVSVLLLKCLLVVWEIRSQVAPGSQKYMESDI